MSVENKKLTVLNGEMMDSVNSVYMVIEMLMDFVMFVIMKDIIIVQRDVLKIHMLEMGIF